MSPEDVCIRPFEAQDLPTVIALLRASMVSYDSHKEEHNARLEAYVQESIKGDLAAHYMAKGDNFWVATIPEQSARAVVGMVALEAKRDGQGAAPHGCERRLPSSRPRATAHHEPGAMGQGAALPHCVPGHEQRHDPRPCVLRGVRIRRDQAFIASPEPPLELVRFEKQL